MRVTRVVSVLSAVALAACSSLPKSEPTDGGTSGGSDAGSAAGHYCPGVDDPSATGANVVHVAPDPGTEPEPYMSGATINKDWALDPGRVYVVTGPVTVEGGTLTIPAGTTLCFAGQGSLSVAPTNPGAIKIMGTAQRHVVLTGFAYDGEPDFHQGLRIGSFARGSEFHYFDIWYGGRGGGSAAYAFDLSDYAEAGDPLPVIDHLTVGELQSKGIALRGPKGIDGSSHIEIKGYVPPTASSPPTYEVLRLHYRAATNVHSGNLVISAQDVPEASRHVALDIPSGNLGADAELNDLGLPFHAVKAQIAAGARWRINEGVTLQWSEGIVLGDAPANSPGNLVVAGTAARHVVMTAQADSGASPAPGDWAGIFFNEGLFDPAVSSLTYLDLRYAGGDFGRNVANCGAQRLGTVAIDGSGQFQGPAMSSVTIDESASAGVAARSATAMGDEYLTTDYTAAVSCGSHNAGPCLDTAKCP
ncbi:MAG TPA: hypothetical protein VGK67_33080 [Myxococcales bacterium]|jgi:hypothetical protein